MKNRLCNILVTGGAGFIGSNFIKFLLNQNRYQKIVNLDLLTYAGSLDNLKGCESHATYQFINGDIKDEKLVATLLRDFKIDTVVHFAAESHVDRSIVGPDAFVQTNIVGTYKLLEATRNYWLKELGHKDRDFRFHHVSTDEVYGSLTAADEPFNEKTAYAPNSPYSASKAASDHMVHAYYATYGLPVTLSSCSNNYGPCQHDEKLIPTIIRSCLQKKKIPIYGDGSNIRDWLHVLDHCHAIDLILQKGSLGETYCIGGDNERSNKDLALLICQILDEMVPAAFRHETLITSVKDRPGHDWRYAINSDKIKHMLGWKSEYSLKKGLRCTIQWYMTKYNFSITHTEQPHVNV